jgi:ATP-dependent exoDNAse (exonuclease V) beta subunit
MVIRASAGSGKTFRLVQEFLTCCLRANREDGVRQILAITFTKKAAQEMRTRIVEYVAEVAAGKGPMFDKLLETGEWKPEELQRSADALRSHMLHHYEDFSVMTIDSFVSRLVRVFARDLRLEDNFDVELSLDVMVEGTVDRLLARVGSGPEADVDVTALLQDFARNQVEDDSDLNLRGQLVKLAKLLAQERIEADLGQIQSDLWTPLRFRELQSRLRRERRAAEQEIAAAARDLLETIRRADLTDAFTKRGSVPGWLRNFAGRPGFKNGATEPVRRQFESEHFTVQNPRPAHRAGIEALLPELRAFWERYSAYYLDEAGGRNRLREALSRRVGLVGTMALLRQEMEAIFPRTRSCHAGV